VLIGTPRRERRRVDPLSAPYSADLNPIEQAFAKLKAILRKAAARTKTELWNTIRRALDQCDADEFEGYLRHYGYGST
jgi:transposase